MESILIAVWVSLGYLSLSMALTENVRQGQSEDLMCRSGTLLDIKYAQYGVPHFLCGRIDVTSIIQEKCQGTRTCTVYAIDKYYNYSCFFRKGRRLLTVNYYCIGNAWTTTKETWTTTLSSGLVTITNVTWQSTQNSTFENQTDWIRSERVTRNMTDKNAATIPFLIGGCLLVVIVLISAAVCYRFRKSKNVENENVTGLQIIPLTSLTSESGVEDSNTRSSENNYIRTGPTDDGTTINEEIEYASIQEHLDDIHPPSYHMATVNDFPSTNTHIHKPTTSNSTYKTDIIGAAKDTKLKSNITNSEHPYENEGINRTKVCGDLSTSLQCDKNLYCDTQHINENPYYNTPHTKENPYCNPSCRQTNVKPPSIHIESQCNNYVNITPGSNIAPRSAYQSYPNRGNSDEYCSIRGCQQNLNNDEFEDKNKGYMTMNYKQTQNHAKESNVYVPIMSPTKAAKRQTFDDTYYL